MFQLAIAPALVTFSRPYFRGYKARLGDQKLAVTSYRGLFPVVEVPAGHKGTARSKLSSALADLGKRRRFRLPSRHINIRFPRRMV